MNSILFNSHNPYFENNSHRRMTAAVAVAEEVLLIGYWPSFFGARLKIALAEKGITYQYHEENFPRKSKLLLRHNPIFRKIPVLVHNGNSINESLLALQYIDEVWKDKAPDFLPSDPYLRYQAKFWAHFIDNKIYYLGGKVWKQQGEVQQVTKKEFIKCLKLLEGILGDEPFFGGKTFGFLDIAFIGYSSWFKTYETYGNLSIESECPKFIPWVERCMKRESVAKSLHPPDEVLKYARMVMKVYGPNRGLGKGIHS